jgi:hypothetical protein
MLSGLINSAQTQLMSKAQNVLSQAATSTRTNGFNPLANNLPFQLDSVMTKQGSVQTNAVTPPGSLQGTFVNSPQEDTRLRLMAQPEAREQVYGPNGESNLLNIFYETNGLLFPYTPIINRSQSVDYETLALTHTNQDWNVYRRTPSVKLSITAEFTIQNQREAKYMLAVRHFLNTMSKMYYGEAAGDLAGLPPPVLLLTGYGNYMYNNLKVLLENFSYNDDNQVSYYDYRGPNGTARLPVYSQISISLIVQNTPKRWRKEFDLNKFRTGELLVSGKGGWI